jgi:lantibiotic transport system permease protein
MIAFINSFQSEWIKKKRSLASWLVIIGGFFTPSIIIIARIVYHDKLQAIYTATDFWEKLWRNSWESMAIFLLPIGVILATSLVTQIEYRNNTWKQLHTTPLAFSTIYFTKLAVIIVMMVQFFILFNIGIYASAVFPWVVFSDLPYPTENINVSFFLRENLFYFIDCLPIIALQYSISLKYKNFLVPIGTGFLVWVAALATLAWKYGYIIPYTYCMYNYLKDETTGKAAVPDLNIHLLALVYFGVITLIGYILYITKKTKG